MEKVVETVALTKEFRDFWGRVKVKAVDDLNLTIYRGEIFGLLGANGSGKTTTLKLMLGLLFPTSGSIKIFDVSPRLVEIKRQLGFLPEESYLYPYHNAEEALFFYGRLFGIDREICRKKVDELLSMVGLQRARKRLIKEYSKGMARRIGIAQALINDPNLVFLDEPTSGLDPLGTREIKDLILQLKKYGKTVILCSHLLADVEDICDRIAILYGGKLQAQGDVKRLLSKPGITQIAVENLAEPQRHKLLAWLGQNGIQNISVSNPRERLEAFFLRVIEEARNKNTATTGAEAGQPWGQFFTEASVTPAQSNIVIQHLLQPNQVEQVAPAIPANFQKTKDEEMATLRQQQILQRLAPHEGNKASEPTEVQASGAAESTEARASGTATGITGITNADAQTGSASKSKEILDKLLSPSAKKA